MKPDRAPRPRSRAAPALAGGATVVLVVLLAVGVGQYLGRRDQTGVAASPSATAIDSPTSSSTATPSQGATPTATARATADPAIGQYIVPLSPNWRPSGTSVVIVERRLSGGGSNEQTVIAVPADGSAPTKIAKLADAGTQKLRRDGRALVIMALTGQDQSRIAFWDLSDGSMRWLTADEPGVRTSNPTFSADGGSVYYGKSTSAGDQGLYQVSVTGGTPKQIHRAVSAPLISIPLAATADGLLLWGAGYEGASVEVLDLTSGKEYSAGTTGIVTVRDGTGPRLLVAQGGGTFCCDKAVVWDHSTGAKRAIFPNAGQVLGFDWSPDGASIAGATRAALTAPLRLETTDRDGAAPKPVTGSDNAQWPLWLRAGITYLYAPAPQDVPATELRIIDPSGGTPKTLYRASPENTLFQYGYVSP